VAPATISPSQSLTALITVLGKTLCNQWHRIPARNNVACEQCVAILNHSSDKKPSPPDRSRPSPPALLRPISISGLELPSSPDERPKARKTRAFDLNNVLDFVERISFFLHSRYEKNFLATLQNVLSSFVKDVKQLYLQISSNNWRLISTIRNQGDVTCAY
jgi:hypothetical protein